MKRISKNKKILIDFMNLKKSKLPKKFGEEYFTTEDEKDIEKYDTKKVNITIKYIKEKLDNVLYNRLTDLDICVFCVSCSCCDCGYGIRHGCCNVYNTNTYGKITKYIYKKYKLTSIAEYLCDYHPDFFTDAYKLFNSDK